MTSIRRPLTPESCHDRLARLTPRQRDCLRLVAKGYQTKEIALLLGISQARVDKHILAARALLGARTRGEAARVFAEWELAQSAPDEGGQPVGAQSMGLPTTDEIAPLTRVDNGAGSTVADVGSFAEQQEPYHVSAIGPTLLDFMPLRSWGRPGNDLSSRKTLIAIAILTAAALIGVGSAVSLLVVLDDLYRP